MLSRPIRCPWTPLFLLTACGLSQGGMQGADGGPASVPPATASSPGGGVGDGGDAEGGAGPSMGGTRAGSAGAEGGVQLNTGDAAGGGGGGTTPPPAPVAPDTFTGAPPFVPGSGGSGEHYPGASCMQLGCHSGGGGDAPAFLIGGTVYKDYKGSVPAPGVEIRLVDTTGKAVSTYSGQNGNFYVPFGAPVGFPAMVGARDGTTARPMITQLTSTMGSCASAGCHIVGGSPSSGAYYPIHVP